LAVCGGKVEAAMSVQSGRRTWQGAVAAHARAAESHQAAAELFARLKDPVRATAEAELAAAERRMYASELASHPEWAQQARI
jgi:hypothetical protein